MARISRETQKKALNRGQESAEDMRELEFGQRPEQWWGAVVEAAKSTKRAELLAPQNCWSVPKMNPFSMKHQTIGYWTHLLGFRPSFVSSLLRSSQNVSETVSKVETGAGWG